MSPSSSRSLIGQSSTRLDASCHNASRIVVDSMPRLRQYCSAGVDELDEYCRDLPLSLHVSEAWHARCQGLIQSRQLVCDVSSTVRHW